MPVPATDPYRRDPRTVANLTSYLSDSPVWVWVYRCGSWRPGVIVQASPRAAMVRYRPNEGVGTSVDTVTGACLAHREEPDAYLDRARPQSNQ
ncbi:hypothetical protein DMB66_54970 [Actinoplanes sp. ATCC 53533]|uniref:hypothetical protein n=1 Tax=Actinoplanes sp. ATCC 53533 TaxID=1288362 RepID=UPI000F77EED8|nr:hypothetical protein [Actinoplanes sp. ATCC 53533]RSM42202.1 hypothetical protein DMB66_54970 [Actinoplanes sp. ATCC 53533]